MTDTDTAKRLRRAKQQLSQELQAFESLPQAGIEQTEIAMSDAPASGPCAAHSASAGQTEAAVSDAPASGPCAAHSAGAGQTEAAVSDAPASGPCAAHSASAGQKKMPRLARNIAFCQLNASDAVSYALAATLPHVTDGFLANARAARVKRYLKGVEAFVRRLILLMALMLEPDIQPDMTVPEGRPKHPKNRKRPLPETARPRAFALYAAPPISGPLPDFKALAYRAAFMPDRPLAPNAEPLIARLRAVQAILKSPDKAARRLAFRLRRQRPGKAYVSPAGPPGLKNFPDETARAYRGLATDIKDLTRARPPPVGPKPGYGPRISVIW